MFKVLFAKEILLLLLLGGIVVNAGAVNSSPSKAIISDPTKPTGYREKTNQAATQYRLESILFGSVRKVAIINGKSFSEGDATKLGTIVRINSDNVVIQGNKRHVLKLVNQSIKKRLGTQ